MSPSITSPAAGSSNTPAATQTKAVSNDPLANESTFLTLLVAQLKNQDPENPPDTNQFLAQLTSYSQLEQLIRIDTNTTPNTDSTTPTTAS